MSALIFSSILALANPLPALAQEVHAMDVSTTDPSAAIRTFGAQAGIQIFVAADDLKGKRLNPVSGEVSTEDGLNKLLAGTGLDHRYVSERTVAVLSLDDSQSVRSKNATVRQGGTGNRRFAQSNQSSTGLSVPRDANAVERDGPSTDALQEIVVSASKRNQSIQDVAASILAISQEDIEKRGIVELRDLAAALPGLNLSTYEPDRSSVSIRGITTSSPIPTVGFYVDDVPVSTSNTSVNGQSDIPLFDTQRIEVLKGPQGTLYGGSALGGAVKFVSNPVNLRKDEVSMTGGVANTQGGEIGYQSSMVANLPIIMDTLGVRIGASFVQTGGFVDRVPGGQATLTAADPGIFQSFNTTLQNNVNTYKTLALRASVLYAPLDSFSVGLDVYYQERHARDSGEYWPNLPQFEESNVLQEPVRNRIAFPILTAKSNLGAVDLTSITGFVDRRSVLTSDSTSTFSVFLPPIATLPTTNADDSPVRNLTQEIRISNADPSARLKFVSGAYFQREDYTHSQTITSAGSAASLGTATPGLPPDDIYAASANTVTTQEALFGDLTYTASAYIDVTLGGRLYHIKQSYNRTGNGFFNGGLSDDSSEGSQSGFTPKVEVTAKLTDHNLIYALADKGFRPGGGNNSVPVSSCAADLEKLGLAAAPSTFKSDSVWNYELGSKNTFADGRVALNAAAFYIDWSKIQQTVALPTCGFQFYSNVGAAVVKGGEFELRASPAHGLTVGLEATYADAHITKSIAGTLGAVGDSVEDSPKLVANADLEYAFSLAGAVSSYARLDYQWHGSQTQQFTRTTTSTVDPFTGASYGGSLTIPDPAYEQRSYDLLNATIGASWGRWNARLYLDNVLNEHPILGVEDQPTLAFTLRPRTVGITASTSF
jgi:iron complex outermembrane receptor protein